MGIHGEILNVQSSEQVPEIALEMYVPFCFMYNYCTHVQALKVRLLWLFAAIEAGSGRATCLFIRATRWNASSTKHIQSPEIKRHFATKPKFQFRKEIALEDTMQVIGPHGLDSFLPVLPDP